MALDLRKFIERFIGEAREHLSTLESGLGLLGHEPLPPERIDGLFRSAHTIKGSARMLKLAQIADTAHHLEDVLGGLREGRLPQDAALGRVMLRAVDALNARIDRLQPDGQDNDEPDQALHEALAAAAAGKVGPTAAAETPAEPDQAQKQDAPEIDGGADQAAVGRGSETASDPARSAPPSAPISAPSTADAVPSVRSPTSTQASLEPGQQPALRAADSVRVPLTRLDELVGMLGELVASLAELRLLGRNARALEQGALELAALVSTQGPVQGLAQVPAVQEALAAHTAGVHDLSRALRADLQSRELLTGMLSERTLVLRMLPLSMVFDPAVRMVRELSRQIGKEVRCEARGGELELDRHIIDKLGDCLLHCLRNAVDHGLEDPAERRAAGKDEVGRIRLSARHAGSGLVIEISDDGRGLSRERILAKAERKGLIDPAQGAQLTDDQVFEMVFQPGFSTSEIITDLSGRGVGLDVVKRVVIDDLHGALALSSQVGQSTRFTIKLPLSLALMRVLVLEADQRRFAFNAQHVVEMIRVEADALQLIAGRPAFVLRNELIPVVPLGELLEVKTKARRGVEPKAVGAGQRQAHLVVIIGVHRSKLGVAVDALVDERDMVIKPLPAHLHGCNLVGGVVRTDEQELVSVLQAPTLIERARRLRGESAIRDAVDEPVSAKADTRDWHLLVVDDSLNTREIEKELLEAHGFRVTTAEDGLDAWQKARGQRFDAVLTDVEMPRLDGFSLTAKLRSLEAYRITPIIIVTSRQKEEDRRRGVEVGADAYIVKGDFDQSSLLETLSNLLG